MQIGNIGVRRIMNGVRKTRLGGVLRRGKSFLISMRHRMRLESMRFDDFRTKVLYQFFPLKPEVINLNANDICNSKCTMCNIWQQKMLFEITPAQLEQILKDDLFTEIKHVGITGGEPTLREDLPDLYEAVVRAIPGVIGLSIITNAIKKDDVIERINKVSEVCRRYGKQFSMMVSVDGYGEVHDMVRGRDGNFESAMEVINYFRKNTNIPVAIGCTISKANVWRVDELLDFMKAEGLYGRFRVAEFIKRLYNDDRGEVVRNFDEEESYHLACFFKKVELTFEKNEKYRRTYRSIISLLTGGQRLIGCPYKAKGLVLDSRGDIHYCAPKSANLGSALNISGYKLFKSGLKERRRILKEDCDNCIHDYHAPITYRELRAQREAEYWKAFFTIGNIHNKEKVRRHIGRIPGAVDGRKRVLITGWYGTETVGDKAILGHILNYYADRYRGEVDFSVSSIHPFVTKKTLRELEVEAAVVSTESVEFARCCAASDEIVMGGGPLMDMEPLALPLWAFSIGKMYKRRNVIFGCGLGPLKAPKYVRAVKTILELADDIWLRDSNSVEYAKKMTGRTDIVNTGDGARKYVSMLDEKVVVSGKDNILACFLREWSTEYKGDLDAEQFVDVRKKFERNLALYIKDICKKEGLIPAFYPMHTFVVGNDDRDFYRRFIREHFVGEEHVFHNRNVSVKSTIEAMKRSKKNVCMRFHSVLFAHTLRTDFIAIDYTNGGKITGFLRDNNSLDRMVSLLDLANHEKKEVV